MDSRTRWMIGLLLALVIGLAVGLAIVAGDRSEDGEAPTVTLQETVEPTTTPIETSPTEPAETATEPTGGTPGPAPGGTAAP